ncbi:MULTISPECIES: ATP-binding protein [Streptomyces]|uniref:ATP-binding protein n=1 Tax=Streptomyces TaxID=1883 RepID=UPI0031EBDF3B
MVAALENRASIEQDSAVPLRYSTAWQTTEFSIADARTAVRMLLLQAGHRPDAQPCLDAQLVVSELVTNALRHAPGPGSLALEVSPAADLLEITVRDGSPNPPRPQALDAGRIGGHGLLLVIRLCEQLHTRTLASGKQIIARLSLGSAAAATDGDDDDPTTMR